MNQEQIIRDISHAVRTQLPESLAVRLTIKEPDYLDKGCVKRWRGRILPLRTKSIFDSAWCFFEIAAHIQGGGAVGFVCFPENKKCGKGIHLATVSEIISRYAASHPNFTASRRGDPAQCLFSRYTAMPPIDLPASDLSALIAETLPRFEHLLVTK